MGEWRLPGNQDSFESPRILALLPTTVMGRPPRAGFLEQGLGTWLLSMYHWPADDPPAWVPWHPALLSQAGHTPGPPRKHVCQEVQATLASYNPHSSQQSSVPRASCCPSPMSDPQSTGKRKARPSQAPPLCHSTLPTRARFTVNAEQVERAKPSQSGVRWPTGEGSDRIAPSFHPQAMLQASRDSRSGLLHLSFELVLTMTNITCYT